MLSLGFTSMKITWKKYNSKWSRGGERTLIKKSSVFGYRIEKSNLKKYYYVFLYEELIGKTTTLGKAKDLALKHLSYS